MLNIPPEVSRYLKSLFRKCNRQAALKLTRIPNVHEEWLDFAIIEQLTQVSVPVRFHGDWTVTINAHWLGSAPLEFFHKWEIADIGLLVVFSSGGKVVRSKIALLQSKRLYPNEQELQSDDENFERYRRGFGGLYPTDAELSALSGGRTFTFTDNSQYKALQPSAPQFSRIADYEGRTQIPVYYLLYNPFDVPHKVNVPLTTLKPGKRCKVGCRVIPARTLREMLSRRKEDSGAPSFRQIRDRIMLPSPSNAGWALEHFVVDLLLQCKTGRITDDRRDPGLYEAFNRRSGPIAAAVSIGLDAPSGFDWSPVP